MSRVKNNGILFDKTIKLTSRDGRRDCPAELRIVGYKDPDTGKTYEFLTNNFKFAASTIAKIYKARWEVELFFKWIKQHLKIKTFLGISKNAVMSQIWIAKCYFLLLSYIKYQTKYRYSLLNLARIIEETLFERRSIIDLLAIRAPDLETARNGPFQMELF